MNTQEGNKLIAEFMKCKEIDGVVWHDVHTMRLTATEDLKYHSSWDWLMPVVKKCFDSVDGKTWFTSDLEFFDLGIWADIATVWQLTIEFIQWFNSEQSVKEGDTSKAT